MSDKNHINDENEVKKTENPEGTGRTENHDQKPEKMKRKKEKRTMDPAQKKRMMNGTYAAAVTAIIIAAVVLVNFIVSAIPDKFTQADVSSQKLYSIGDTTKNLLSSLDKDVTLYYITESGREDEAVQKLVENYAANSDHVKVTSIDAVTNPTFAQQYTDDTVTLNSVIAVCGDKSKVADYNTFYSYDSYYSTSASSFDAEGQITSAVASVALDSSATIYYTTGHNEFALSTEMTDAMSKANIESKELNLLTGDVPEDCSALLIFAPVTDFTEEEADKVISYLQDGGHALIVSVSNALTDTETPNFNKILSTYGITRKGGLVMEGDANSYVQVPYLIMPTVGTSDATQGLDNVNILDALPEAAETAENDDATYTVQSILTTSSSSYNKTELTGSMEKASGDEEGPFTVGVQVEDTISSENKGTSDVETDSAADSTSSDAQTESGTDGSSEDTKETKILYFTSPCLFSSNTLSTLLQTNTSLPAGNTQLFANALTFLTDQTVTVSVPAKDLSIPQTTVSSGIATGVGNIFMFVLPAAVLVAGFVIWGKRRRA